MSEALDMAHRLMAEMVATLNLTGAEISEYLVQQGRDTFTTQVGEQSVSITLTDKVLTINLTDEETFIVTKDMKAIDGLLTLDEEAEYYTMTLAVTLSRLQRAATAYNDSNNSIVRG